MINLLSKIDWYTDGWVKKLHKIYWQHVNMIKAYSKEKKKKWEKVESVKIWYFINSTASEMIKACGKEFGNWYLLKHNSINSYSTSASVVVQNLKIIKIL